MKTNTKHIASYCIRIFLMAFWLYVALDKLWDLPAFHRSLLRQPFPDWWADVLYWMLPLAELGIAVNFLLAKERVIVIPAESQKKQSLFLTRLPFLLSTLLLLIFTIYIGLGVTGLYAKRPCGCASVFSRLSWDWHLLVNTVLLGLSILGWHLRGQITPTGRNRTGHKKFAKLFLVFSKMLIVPIYDGGFFIRRRFPRRFAPFPGRPV